MSRSHALFDQCYECGDKKFYNIWQAFDHQHLTGHSPHYTLDQDFIASIKNIKRPINLNHQYIKNLMVNRLKQLRKQYKYLRLALGGGTDSFSILKYCVDNDIYLDEVFTHMVSINPNVKSNIEYLPALLYAEKHQRKQIGNVVRIHPTMEECEFPLQNGWYKNPNLIRGNHLPVRPSIPSQYYTKSKLPLDESVTIFGFDKPYVINENGTLYWMQMDSGIGEIMGCKNVLPLFFDKENPELTVSMTYALLENSNTDASFIGYDIQPKEHKLKILNAMGLESTGYHFIDHHLLGKSKYEFQNKKNMLYHAELKQHGRHDIIDAYFRTHKLIISQYQNLTHAIETLEKRVVKTVLRQSKKIPIYQHSFGS